jgi:hypothetical protein
MDVEDLIHEDVLSLLIVEHLEHTDGVKTKSSSYFRSPFFIASRIVSRSFLGNLSNKRFSKTKTAAS